MNNLKIDFQLSIFNLLDDDNLEMCSLRFGYLFSSLPLAAVVLN